MEVKKRRRKRGRPKKRKPAPKINDQVLDRKKYYPWYYNQDLEVNVIPIGFYSLYHAQVTLVRQLGDEVLKEIFINSGEVIRRRHWVLAKNAYYFKGKYYRIRKHAYPPEYYFKRSLRARLGTIIREAAAKAKTQKQREAYVEKVLYKIYGLDN